MNVIERLENVFFKIANPILEFSLMLIQKNIVSNGFCIFKFVTFDCNYVTIILNMANYKIMYQKLVTVEDEKVHLFFTGKKEKESNLNDSLLHEPM